MNDGNPELQGLLGQHLLRVERASFLGGPADAVRSWVPGGAVPPSVGVRVAEPAPAEEVPGPPVPEQPEVPASCPSCDAVLAEAEAQLQDVLETLREPYLNAAAHLEKTVQDLTAKVRRDVVRLAVRLAEVVVERVVELDRTIAEETVARAFRMAGGVEVATVLVHPDDLEAIAARAPELAANVAGKAVDLTVRAADDVALGSCIIKFADGTVDARWHAQLLYLRDMLDAVVVSRPHGAAARRSAPDEEGES